MDATITLKQYLDKNKTFVIPDYQRGYVWGKQSDKKNAVESLMDDLITRFSNHTEVFLQGVTVTETADEIILIDGQQRTTCFYLLLKYLGYKGRFIIRYDIRKSSGRYLECLNFDDVDEDVEEELQDVYFFKKTIRIIRSKLNGIDGDLFLDFVLNNVKFLYINVESDQASKIFTMMNGNRAQMSHEEIIKAEILRLASLNIDGQFDYIQEWEHNMLRSRYAREWDKWLHWWNDARVKTQFNCDNCMGLLIAAYLRSKKDCGLTFGNFKTHIMRNNTPLEAKQTFDGLRRLQKRFEDVFNDPVLHNMTGAILRLLDRDNQKKFIDWYFVNDNRDDLEDYYKLVFLGMTHDEIVSKNSQKFADKYDNMHKVLADDLVYVNDSAESVYRFLLRLNVDQDNLQKRVFNFKIWEERSLEHIMPKSVVGHLDLSTGKWLDGNDKVHDAFDFTLTRDDIKFTTKDGETVSTTEHSIGNLVLLYKNENSQFNKNDFLTKKQMFFSPQKTGLFKSRHLLHTICVFAEKEHWDGPSIAENKLLTLKKFEADYCELKKEFGYEEQD